MLQQCKNSVATLDLVLVKAIISLNSVLNICNHHRKHCSNSEEVIVSFSLPLSLNHECKFLIDLWKNMMIRKCQNLNLKISFSITEKYNMHVTL